MYQLTKYRVDVDGPRPESYMEDRQLAQHLPADQVSPSTWQTASWISICLQTRWVPLPGRPTAGSPSACRPGKSLYLQDRQLAQHLPLDQVSLSTWKTDSWLSICLQTRWVSLPGKPTAGSASASGLGESLFLEDRQLAQVSLSTWKTDSWFSICLRTRWVPLPGRPPAGSASVSRPGKSLYLEDRQLAQHLPPDQVSPSTWRTGSWLSICLQKRWVPLLEDRQLAQHLPPDQVSLSTWKTATWLSICLQTRWVSLPGWPPPGSASASRPGESLYQEDRHLAQHLPPDQVSLSTWKTASWLSICL